MRYNPATIPDYPITMEYNFPPPPPPTFGGVEFAEK